MAQLDHQLSRLYFEMSTQVRRQAADAEALAQQYAAMDATVDLQATIYLKDTLELFESNGLEMVTMSVNGDGNCMAHSISRAICGLEVFFHVLRTELLAELEANAEFYRDPSIASGFYTDEDWVRDLESAGPSQMGQAGMWMSGMHIFGMANVLRRPIFLVDARQNAGATEPDLMVVTQLVEMGFTQQAALRAAVACQNRLDECMQWVLDHEHDPMLNEPVDAGSHHRAASASARGGLFLPLRFTPEECQVNGVMPSPLMIACANADASHFCSVVTVEESEPEDDGVVYVDWVVPEGAEGGKEFSDTIEVNGRTVVCTGMVPPDAMPGDVVKLGISKPGSMGKRGGSRRVPKGLAQKLKQNSGLQQRQLSAAVHHIVEDGTAIVHALSTLLTGQRCEPKPDETEQLYEGYLSGMGKEPISVVFVNTEPEDLTMVQMMADGRAGKTWPLFSHGQLIITTPVGAHFRMLNAKNERVWSVTILDEHAEDEMIMVDTSQRVMAPALESQSLGAIRAVVSCLGAIVAKPDQPKLRKLPKTNKIVSERMLPVDGVRDLMEAVGFVEEVIDEKPCLYLPETNLDLARLNGVLETLRSALSTQVQFPHPFQFAVTISCDADAHDGAALKPTGSPSLSGRSSSAGGSQGSAAWSDASARADTIRRHVIEVSGGLQLLEKAGGFEQRAAMAGAGESGSGSSSDGTGAGTGMSLCLQAIDLHAGLQALEALEEARGQLLAVSASRLRFGIDSEAFGQIQFTQGLCEANDWDYARRYANGDGCWEFGCGKNGAEPTLELMENARTRFSQLLGKDFRSAMRKHVPVTCTGCDAALVVTQQQIESTKGSMVEITCPNCATPVTITAPSLHDEIQEALNREGQEVGRNRSGGGRSALGRGTSSGSSISSTSSGGGAGAGYVLGRSGSTHEDDGDSISTISSITPDPVPRSNSSSRSGISGRSGSSRSSRTPEPEPEPSGPRPDIEEGEPIMILGTVESEPEATEFDKVLGKLRRDVKQTSEADWLDLAEPSQLPSDLQPTDPDGGAGLTRSLSLGRRPTGGPFEAHEAVPSGDTAKDNNFNRLVAELCDSSYGFARGAVVRALTKSSGDLFRALDMLEEEVGPATGGSQAEPVAVSS